MATPSTPSASRRTFLAGCVAGLSIAPAVRAAAPAPPLDPRLRTTTQAWKVGGVRRFMAGYLAVPSAARGRQPAVLLIHDDAGLTDAMRDLARRVALSGCIAVAPDFLTPGAGTPPDAGAARLAIAARYPPQTLHDAQMTLYWLRHHRYTTGRVAALGIGWGADLVGRLAAVSGPDLAATVLAGAEAAPASPLPSLALPATSSGLTEADAARAVTFLKEHLA